MSFIEETLMPGEEVKFRTKLSKVTAKVATVIYGLIGLLFVAKLPALTIFFWLIPASLWIKYRTSEFVVTNRRVLIKVGVLQRRSLELLLTKIESIRFDQGFLERFFFGGMGKIVIIGSGGTPETFANIDKPLEFRRQIQIQIEGLHGTKTNAAAS